MKFREFPEIARVAFLELVANESIFHGRTYSYFDPAANKKMGYNIFIIDNATGFSVCIPVKKPAIIFLEKDDLKVIMKKILEQMVAAIKKYPQAGKPVDENAMKIKAGQKMAVLDKRENLDKVKVNCYRWSQVLVA